MNARFLHPSARNTDAAAAPGTAASPAELAELPGLADCCPAKAAVRVVMARQHTDLLLCGHHYRASRHTLASAATAVRALPGTPSDIRAWLQLDRYAQPAAAC